LNFGSTFVALETSGRLFGLDYQLLFDAAITAINVFILFLLVSVILFNPVRNMLKKRQVTGKLLKRTEQTHLP
jgi:F-type H+-transporting ATPase subunit b